MVSPKKRDESSSEVKEHFSVALIQRSAQNGVFSL